MSSSMIVQLAPIQCIAPLAANNLQSDLSSASLHTYIHTQIYNVHIVEQSSNQAQAVARQRRLGGEGMKMQ